MSAFTLAYYRFRWLHVPAAVLMVLLQRLPMLRNVVTTEFVMSSGINNVLKGVLATSAAMGAVQTVAGATELDAGMDGNPASATVGQEFAGGFAVVGAPATAASYEITGDIPAGLTVTNLVGDTVNGSTVTVTGTPTEAGSFVMNVRAWRGANKTLQGGTPTFSYTINVAAAEGTAPSISSQPVSQTAAAGGSVSFSVTASGDPAPTFQWQKDGADVADATDSTLTINSVAAADAGDYTVIVSNSAGNVTSSAATLTVGDPPAVTITSAPASVDVDAGANVNFSVGATSSGALSYQWFRFKSGEGLRQLAGATSSSLALSAVDADDMGIYFVRVSNGGTSVDSSPAILTLTGGESRLANLSTRGSVPANGQLVPGFVLQGTGTKDIVVRAAGPLLAGFGVSTAMSDPQLDLVPPDSSEPRVQNDNWESNGNLADLVAASSSVGALPFESGSNDSAIFTGVPLGSSGGSKGYTVEVSSTDGSGGIALAEVYDVELSSGESRLVNVSARGFSGLGENALIPGFVISGSGAKTMLIRVGGPLLAEFGLPGTMTDPRLEVIPGGQTFVVAENDNWGGTEELKQVFQLTGAFPFPSDDSRDAAVLVRLPPGAYTVRPSGAADGVGEIIVEAYEVLE